MSHQQLSIEVVGSLLTYCSDTGMFTWKEKPAVGVSVGSQAGSISRTGYRRIRIRGKGCQAHRLAWLLVKGVWPEGHIDHINGDRMDNRISNLRQVTCQQNAENRRSPSASNKSGYLGVSWCATDKKWKAQIFSRGKCKSLGRFDSAEIAHQAYLSAKRAIHEGCTI